MQFFRIPAIACLSFIALTGGCGQDASHQRPELITPTFSAEEAINIATNYLREQHALPRLYDLEATRVGREWLITYTSLPHTPDAYITVHVDDARNAGSYMLDVLDVGRMSRERAEQRPEPPTTRPTGI